MKALRHLLACVLLLLLLAPGRAQLSGDAPQLIITNEPSVNTDQLEFSPAFYRDGIVYLSTRSGSFRFKVTDELIDENIMTLYRSRRGTDGALQAGEPFATDLLVRAHEGPLTFDRTAETMYYTRNADKGKTTTAPDGLRKLQIYEAKLTGGKWREGVRLPFNDYGFNTLHPSINADGDKLYFASDRPGGQGGMDIWVVKKIGEDWGEPLNLGAQVNGPENEVFPFIHPDGTLYLASDRADGRGKLDLYRASKDKKANWQRPRNLGAGFNTAADDFGLVLDVSGINGYFSSNRPGGSGGDDIYRFYQNNDTAPADADRRSATVRVWNADGQPVEAATVSALDLDRIILPGSDGEDPLVLDPRGDRFETLTAGSTTVNAKTDPAGLSRLDLRDGRYLLTVAGPGYQTQQLILQPDNDWDNVRVVLGRADGCVTLTGKVLSPAGPYAKAQIYITDSEQLKETVVYSDADGNYTSCLPCGKTYSVFATDRGITSPTAVVATDCQRTEPLQLQLRLSGQPRVLAVDDVVGLNKVYYNFNDAALRPDAYPELNKLVRLLTQYPDMRIELASHTDARGSAAYNLQLSQRRSNSVLDYLLAQGIAVGRVDPVGYGETRILNACTDGVRCGEAQHQENRRTEFRVLAVDGALSDRTTNYPVPGTTMRNPSVPVPTERLAMPTTDNDGRAVLVTQRDAGLPADRIIENPDPVSPAERVDYPGSTGRYTLVAGTFSVAKNAEKRARQLRDAGYGNVRIVDAGVGLRAVEVARFDTETAAESLRITLQRELGLRAYVRD